MLNIVELVARVTGGALEVRATPNRVSDVTGDMRRFVNASSLPLDIATATPTDDVLLHMFGICTNHLLALARLPLISGPSWDSFNREGAEIISGNLRVGYSSSAWLARQYRPRDLEWSVVPQHIVPTSHSYVYSNVLTDSNLHGYQMDGNSSMAITFISDAPSDLFSTHGVYGRVMFKYPSHYFSPTARAAVPGIAVGDQTYTMAPNTFPSSAINLNGVPIRVNDWIEFDGEFTLRSFAPFSGALFMTFDIRNYSSAGSPWFIQTQIQNSPSPSQLLPPIPTSVSIWSSMYRRAVDAFNVDSPSLIPSAFITREYVDLVLLLNSHFS